MAARFDCAAIVAIFLNMDNTPNGFIPVLPVRNTVIFPGLALPLRVGRSKSVAAVEHAQENGMWLRTLTQKTGRDTGPESDAVDGSDLYRVGVLSKIEKIRGSS